jgi:hypothetical protein
LELRAASGGAPVPGLVDADRERAQARERKLVHELRPPYNVHYTGDNPTIPSPSAYRRVRPHLDQLSTLLRVARESVRPELSGNALASRMQGRRTCWGQGKVSLLEAGRSTPTEDDLGDWAAETGADLDKLMLERDRALLRDVGDVLGAARLPGGIANATDEEVATLRASSSTNAEYQPTLIPDLAQTPAYTRAWLTQPARVVLGDPPDVDDLIARRAERQRAAAARRVVVAVTPWALTAAYGTVETQRAQLDALADAVEAGRVELIVEHEPIALLHGFELLDDVVLVETVANVQVMGATEVLGQFRAALADLRDGGATGAAALRELRQARDSL